MTIGTGLAELEIMDSFMLLLVYAIVYIRLHTLALSDSGLLLSALAPLLNLSTSLLDLSLELLDLDETRLLILDSLGFRFNGFARLLALVLVLSANGNVPRLEIAEELLQDDLDRVAPDKIEHHDDCQGGAEFVGKVHEHHFLVELRNELGRTGECNGSDTNDTPEHALVLRDGLTERTALVVDGESRDLLNELQKVDGSVEKRGAELCFQIDVKFTTPVIISDML